MPPVGFEPTISAGKRPQTYALDRAATGTGIYFCRYNEDIRVFQTKYVYHVLISVLPLKYIIVNDKHKFKGMCNTVDSSRLGTLVSTIVEARL